MPRHGLDSELSTACGFIGRKYTTAFDDALKG